MDSGKHLVRHPRTMVAGVDCFVGLPLVGSGVPNPATVPVPELSCLLSLKVVAIAMAVGASVGLEMKDCTKRGCCSYPRGQ